MSEPASPDQPAALQGALYWINPERVRGWAYAADRPQEAVRVDIRLDGALVATTIAALPFEKLAPPGVIGDHVFLATPSEKLPVMQPARLRVIATSSSGEVLELRRAGHLAGRADKAGAAHG